MNVKSVVASFGKFGRLWFAQLIVETGGVVISYDDHPRTFAGKFIPWPVRLHKDNPADSKEPVTTDPKMALSFEGDFGGCTPAEASAIADEAHGRLIGALWALTKMAPPNDAALEAGLRWTSPDAIGELYKEPLPPIPLKTPAQVAAEVHEVLTGEVPRHEEPKSPEAQSNPNNEEGK